MIGVIADPADQEIVGEFFELFKTPWEFYRDGGQYDVLLCQNDGTFEVAARLTILYASTRTRFDDEHGTGIHDRLSSNRVVKYHGTRLHLYGGSVSFSKGDDSGLLTDRDSERPVAYVDRLPGRALARVGYDLFGEVGILLSAGQPAANAAIPALDLHIELLRELIIGAGISFTEIPPVPDGHQFIACLTHDVDHPSIRQHKWDHTAIGFLYRATAGSVSKLIRGELSMRDLVANWVAALKLPLIHLGLAKDIWRDFDRRYLELENGLPSTFFLIPFANRRGAAVQGDAPKRRAARYGASDLADSIQRLAKAGCEIALHGIDAWIDASNAAEEFQELRIVAGVSDFGVRMHWLYYGRHSPKALEEAGATYDSTVGYNGTVGYRAGTTQVYKPIGATRLLELPLHIMDTALFYPAYLGFSRLQAKAALDRIVGHAVQFGGCVTVNWHDRSLAPERLWDGCYRELIQCLRDRGAWFATASEAVAWFRKRRSATFSVHCAGERFTPATGDFGHHLPGLHVRIHNARTTPEMANAYREEC